MKDEAHVRLVDAHAEGDGRADDATVLAQECVVIGCAHGMIEPGMIGQRAPAEAGEFVGQLFGAAARGAIDDAAFPAMGVEPLDELARRIRLRPHREKEIGPVERAHEHLRLAHEQFRGDLRTGRSVRRRRDGDGLKAAERLGDLAQPQIFGPEIVAPLRDAMSLVDGETIDRGVPQVGDERRRAAASRARCRGGAASAREVRCAIRRRSSTSVEELRLAASTPSSRNCATWSRISAISGDTTSVRPSRTIGGSWKQSDLPLPVGITASTSFPCRVAARISS